MESTYLDSDSGFREVIFARPFRNPRGIARRVPRNGIYYYMITRCWETWKLMENQENIIPDIYGWCTKIQVTIMLYGAYQRILRLYIRPDTENSDNVALPHSWAKGGCLHRWLIDLINIWLCKVVAIIFHLLNITILVRHVICYLNGFLSVKHQHYIEEVVITLVRE